MAEGGGGAELGAAGGAAGAIPALIGRGKNKRTAGQFYGSEGYDPNASRFGGYEGGLRDYRGELERRRREAEARGAYLANYAETDRYQNMGLAARGGQDAAAQMMLARAQGRAPSIAQMQADRQMNQAAAQQAALSASARGPAALALAQGRAAANTATAQGAISNQAQINAAQERLAAEQAAAGAFGGIRQGDTAGQQLAAERAQFQAQMQQRNREANDLRRAQQDQLEGQALGQELAARTQNQGTLGSTYVASEGQNQQTANQNAQNKGLIETFGDLISSDSRAKLRGNYIKSDFAAKLLPWMYSAPFDASGGLQPNTVIENLNRSLQMGEGGGSIYMLGTPGNESKWVTPAVAKMLSDDRMAKMLSDDRAKLAAAWDAGHAAAVADVEKLARQSPDEIKRLSEGDDYVPAAAAVRTAKAIAWDEAQQAAERDRAELAVWRKRDQEQAKAEAAKAADRAQEATARRQQQSSPAHLFKSLPEATMVLPRILSDFTAKARLGPIKGWGEPEPARPDQARYVPGTGWVQPGAGAMQAKEDALDAAMAKSVDEDREASEVAAQAAQGNDLLRQDRNRAEAEKIRRGFDNDEEARKIRAAFAADEGGGGASFWDVFGQAGQALYRGQFGDRSDRRAKIVMGPEKDVLADMNRKMKGEAYVYRPGMTPEDQEPGELNYGFMAQNLEKNPISATAVKEDETGMKRVDAHKMIKILASGLSDLQGQVDETRMALAKWGKRRR